MKKYIKPDISFYKLNLSTTVSAGCQIQATHDPEICPVEIPGQGGLTVFQKGGCMVYGPGMGDGLCYHVPSAESNVFES